MFVKPQLGLQVFDPIRRDNLPEQGRLVPRDPYWVRRLRDKDVVETDPSEVAEDESQPKTTTKPKKKGA